MFKKRKIKSEIKKLKKLLFETERKRYRSQAAIVEALLIDSEPDDTDVEYFNKYTGMMNEMRDRMHALQNELKYV